MPPMDAVGVWTPGTWVEAGSRPSRYHRPAVLNVETEYLTGLPSKGTMSHSLIQSYDSELEAFRSYAKHNPNNIILLVDTYNTLESGVPNAIKVFTELKERGALHPPYGIRLDSGDLAYLSKEARRMLDEAGLEDAIISASSDLDEHLIRDLKLQGACIDLWGWAPN